MDVEGHEYKILRHVWERSPSALCKLSIMAIEWHERMMESDQGGAQEWTKRLQSCNTPVSFTGHEQRRVTPERGGGGD